MYGVRPLFAPGVPWGVVNRGGAVSLLDTELDSRGVFTITLNDPDRRNALSQELSRSLLEAMTRVEDDPHIRLVVLTNLGSSFCAGADLSERNSGTEITVDPLGLAHQIMNSSKIWVGRIAGHAVAAGTGLAAACDISVAHDDAKFGFTEVRLGIAPAVMSTICLPKMRLGDARAAFLRGRLFDGTEAARIGLINTAVPPEDLDDEVAAAVDDLLLGGPEALTATKDILRRVPEMHADERTAWAKARSAELFSSQEAREGIAAFQEKRSPNWVAQEESES